MTEEVKRHIFEPFFTTKGAGKGTGLGLSTCYGIVKQSGGDLSVDSEPGQGCTIKIYLPQVEESSLESLPLEDTPLGLPKGTETVLLAEDEPAVRDVATQMLRQQGYHVLPAANGAEALGFAWMYASEKIDLLLTDVIMPRMNGKELADQLGAIHPEARVLYTSGYTDDTIGRHGVLSPDIQFLPKPFSPPELAHKVREVLDEVLDKKE
jgi:CheY-like chemotaxis protein